MPLTAVLYSALGVLVMDANMHSLLSCLSVLACSARYLADTHKATTVAKKAWDCKSQSLTKDVKRLMQLNDEILSLGCQRAMKGDYNL